MRENIRQRAAIVASTVALLTLMGGASAFAVTDPTDPTGGSGDTFITSLQSYLQTHLIAAVLGLAVIGVVVGMIIKWGKKAAKSA